MSIRIGIGVDVFSRITGAIAAIVNAFKTRVLADSGTFEAESCLTTIVTDFVNKGLYDSASIILTPNAVKTSKIYALKGTDFTFTRSSVANRINSVGAIESMAANIARLDYSNGSCPALLSEPAATNLFLNSFAPVTQNITVVNGTIYTVSISGGTATLSGAGTGSATTGNKRTFTASGTTLTVTISGTPSWCQCETGSSNTSPIITTTAAVTRTADVVNTTKTFTANSTIYLKVFLNAGSLSDGVVYSILDIRTAANNRITLYRFNNTIQLDILNTSVLFSGNILTIPTLVQNTVYKIAIVTTATTLIVYINGVAVYTNNSLAVPTFNSATFNYGNGNGISQWNGLLGENAVYDTNLNSTQAISLTT